MMALTLAWPVWVLWFSPKVPKNEPAPVSPVDPAATDKAEADARAARMRKRGRSQNILTSPAGAKLGESGQGGQQTLGTP